ncbi:hypothetical protein K2Z84_31920 [Candidatus Binatia bacterium]|jgi:hypothetical protein|nr:hypothetical protein [Candidatus Binatia bacterium]
MPWLAILLSALLVGGPEVRQLQVRFDGYLGATQKETDAFEELQVRVGERPMQSFALTNVVSLMGGGPMGTDIVDQMLPIKPNFIFTGDPKLIQHLADAKPNQLLRITGWTQWGSQYVLVETVEEGEPVTGPTPTPNLRKKLLGF